MVVSYNGSVSTPAPPPAPSNPEPGVYHQSMSMMTATTETVLDSVLVSSLVKNEPEDLTGQRHRYTDLEYLWYEDIPAP